MIWEGVALEEGVFVGPRVSFTNDSFTISTAAAGEEQIQE
jgi:hypothetical protein